MKLAVMQPYLFPYIGYFQLAYTVDKFVFYDDVNFIKNGWINRNQILLNKKPHYLTVQLKNASSFKQINEVEFTDNRPKLIKTLEQSYKKAPYYNAVFQFLQECLSYPTNSISELAIYSITQTCKYLRIETKFGISSCEYSDTKGLEKAERLHQICRVNNANVYINPIGGQKIYSKKQFKLNNIDLYFIKSNLIEYSQFNHNFVPWLSIIDVMMFNSIDQIRKMLDRFELI